MKHRIIKTPGLSPRGGNMKHRMITTPGLSPRGSMRGGCPVRSNVCLVLLATALSAIAMHGCSNREPVASSVRKPGIDQKTVLAEMLAWQPPDAAQPAMDPAQPAEPQSAVAPDGNMLANGSFELRDADGRPRGWIVSPLDGILPSSEAGADAYEGKESLTLRGHATNWTVVSMNARLIDKDLGKKVVASAWGKVTAGDAMYLSIAGNTASGTNELVRKPWPASVDQWTQLTVEAIIPRDVDPASVRVIISVRNNPEILARLDQVSFVFK